jgi:adenylate cyclase
LPSISKLLRLNRVRVLSLTLVVFAGLAAMTVLQVGQTLENQGLDLCYRFRPIAPPPPELLIVGIDEHSFQEMRRAWPWPRRFHAELIRRLKAAGARLIVFDVLFADPTDPEDDRLFTEAIGEAGNVILAATVEVSEDSHVCRQIIVQPLESLRRAARGVGLALVTPDGDGVVRRFHLRFEGTQTLPQVVTGSYLPDSGIPADLSGLIRFAGPPGHIHTVSYSSLLEGNEPALTARIRGNIILIGSILESSPLPLADNFYTPFFPSTGQLMSGVEVHGQIIHTLLQGSWGQEMDILSRLVLYLAFMLLFGAIIIRVSPLAALGFLVGLILVIFWLSFYLMAAWRLWVPPVLLSVSLVLVYAGHSFSHYLLETQEKRWLRQAFGHYVSESLVEDIIAFPERLQLGGEEVEVTVLFADLINFSTLAENTAPQELIRLLNDYFSAMTEIILAHHGTVDKFIGDAIMAFWGAPLPQADHALLACRAALEMQEALRGLQSGWQAQGFPLIAARVGLHSGPAVAGNVGSRERFNYTVMGDAVNLAARLEGANKTYGTEIILSEATCRLLPDTFLVRELDVVQVRGRAHPVEICELLGPMPSGGPPDWLRSFQEARAAYMEGKWQEAADRFQELLSLNPHDHPAQVFLKRCHKYLEKPPLAEWQGIFVLETK